MILNRLWLDVGYAFVLAGAAVGASGVALVVVDLASCFRAVVGSFHQYSCCCDVLEMTVFV